MRLPLGEAERVFLCHLLRRHPNSGCRQTRLHSAVVGSEAKRGERSRTGDEPARSLHARPRWPCAALRFRFVLCGIRPHEPVPSQQYVPACREAGRQRLPCPLWTKTSAVRLRAFQPDRPYPRHFRRDPFPGRRLQPRRGWRFRWLDLFGSLFVWFASAAENGGSFAHGERTRIRRGGRRRGSVHCAARGDVGFFRHEILLVSVIGPGAESFTAPVSLK
jgi:hypothetical protein